MLKINKTRDELENDLSLFIWEFKIKDNILYNIDILNNLIDDYNNSKKDYKKPISIISASIIEAIMIDLLNRLHKGTKHFPDILRDLKDDIKNKLETKTTKTKFTDINNEEWSYSILQNFNFSSVIKIYKELKLLGIDDEIYNSLSKLAWFRNRVHINNYYKNFEKDECITFSEKRVQSTINLMVWCIEYFKRNYKRNWS